MGQVGAGLARVGTIGATVAAAGLGAVVTTAISFESAFAGVRKTVDATAPELEVLRKGFKDLTREIPLSFEELAGIGEQAGALGIAKEDILEFTRVVALIGTTTNVSTQDAATSLGQLSNVLGLVAEDYDNFGATLVDLGNKGASTEADILALATRAGAGANLIGIASDQTLGWASSVANLGIEVEAGGSSLQKFFLDTLQNIQKSDTLNLMAKTAGQTGEAFKQAFEKDASGALVSFIQGLGKLKQAEQLAVLEALGFNDVRITRTLLGLAGDTDNLTDSLNTASTAWEKNTALTEEAQKRFETTEAQLTILKEGIRGAGDTIGSALLPKLTPLIADLNKFLTDHEADIAKFGTSLAEGFETFATKLRGADFGPVIGALETLGRVGKTVVDIFMSLPPGVQSALVAGFAVNKLSGGLIGSGIGNVAGGLIKMVFTRGNTPAAPLFVFQTNAIGGVGGIAPAAGAAGGVLGTVRSIATKVILAGIAVEAGLLLGKFVSDRLVDLGVGGIKPAKEYEQAAVTSAVNSGDVTRIVAGINSIDEQLKPSLTDVGLSLEDSGAAIALALDIGGVKSQLEADRQVLLDQLAEMGLTRAEAERLVDATNLAATRADRAAERVTQEQAKGNALAQTIRDKATTAVEEARQTKTQAAVIARMTERALGPLNTISAKGIAAVEEARQTKIQAANIARYTSMLPEPSRLTALQAGNAARMTERTLGPLGVIAAKKTSFTANITTNVNARLSVTQALSVQTLFRQIKSDQLTDAIL